MDFSKLLVPTPEPLHVAIAGLIGVGKSSMADALSKHWDAVLIKEPVEQNAFLTAFYEEMANLEHPKPMLTAYPLQMALLSQRIAAVITHLNETLINDRSAYEDAIFVKMLTAAGNMSNAQAQSYADMFNSCFSLLPKPTVIVWLRASPEACFERIKKRARGMESGISLDYLKQLSDAYEEFFEKMHGRLPFLVVNREHGSEPGTPEYDAEVAHIVESIRQFQHKTTQKLHLVQ